MVQLFRLLFSLNNIVVHLKPQRRTGIMVSVNYNNCAQPTLKYLTKNLIELQPNKSSS